MKSNADNRGITVEESNSKKERKNSFNLKDKLKAILQFIANPRLLLCLGIAWIITNGWSYAALALGTCFGIEWLSIVGGAYLAFLWLPATPEKIITVTIAIVLMKKLFPDDKKTLAVLHELYQRAKATVKKTVKKGLNRKKSS